MMQPLTFGGLPVPWNASWSGERRFEIRPCRWAEGMPAMWQPFAPGSGRPIFAKPHFVRQRRSIAQFLCTVCGDHTPRADRWWFGHGTLTDGMYMTTESPVHRACAVLALQNCPHLKGKERELARFPDHWTIVRSMLGGEKLEEDFGVHVGDRQVVGALKFAWTPQQVRFRKADAA
jgi:hypothetical protein